MKFYNLEACYHLGNISCLVHVYVIRRKFQPVPAGNQTQGAGFIGDRNTASLYKLASTERQQKSILMHLLL